MRNGSRLFNSVLSRSIRKIREQHTLSQSSNGIARVIIQAAEGDIPKNVYNDLTNLLTQYPDHVCIITKPTQLKGKKIGDTGIGGVLDPIILDEEDVNEKYKNLRPVPGHVSLGITDSEGMFMPGHEVSLVAGDPVIRGVGGPNNRVKGKPVKVSSGTDNFLLPPGEISLYHADHTTMDFEIKRTSKDICKDKNLVVSITLIPMTLSKVSLPEFKRNIAAVRQEKIYNLCSAFFNIKEIEEIEDPEVQANVMRLVNLTEHHKYFKGLDLNDDIRVIIATMACTIAVIQSVTGYPYSHEEKGAPNYVTQAVAEEVTELLVGNTAYRQFMRCMEKEGNTLVTHDEVVATKDPSPR